jgi:beta-glucosidase
MLDALPIEEDSVGGSDVPEGFIWGAATAAYQVEGAVSIDGRGESIWDRFAHTPGHIAGGSNGDVACDHYHRFAEDIGILSELGLDAYRFSVSWPRVIPDGVGPVNPAGLDFYDRLVDRLLDHGITPHATLYHWDLPQVLEDRGGWPVRQTADAFVAYAEVVARRLGDRVGFFSTLNEPFCSSFLGYRVGIHAPGRTDPAAAIAASHHLLVAHGLAVPAIRAAAPAANVGIVLNFEPQQPASQHLLDQEAASLANDQYNRWFLDPITGRGYPEGGARAWGWDRSEVQDGDLGTIAAPLDFLGVNYYTRHLVRSPLLPPIEHGREPERTAGGWEIYPEGLTEVLEFVRSRTGDLPLYVMENGAAFDDDPTDPAHDPLRVDYLRRHVAAAQAALARGVPLHGYFAWSLLDNFEWAEGYTHRFGLVHVDFETQRRTIRDSGRYWASLAATRAPAEAMSEAAG